MKLLFQAVSTELNFRLPFIFWRENKIRRKDDILVSKLISFTFIKHKTLE